MLQEPGTVAQPNLQPVQQQGDLIVQDIEDDLLDVTIAAVTSSGASHACSQLCLSVSQDAKYSQAQQHQVPRHEVMLAQEISSAFVSGSSEHRLCQSSVR